MAKADRIVVGSPSKSDLAFALQVRVEDSSKAFSIELPGAVIRVGKGYMLGILPIARIVTGSGRTMQGTTVSFAEKNRAATNKALASFDQAIEEKTPRKFRLLAESAMTYADVAQAAAAKRGKRKSPAGEVILRMECRLAGGRTVVSDPIPGVVVAAAVLVRDLWADDWWQLFDCYSEWWRKSAKEDPARRWFTRCYGSCPAGSGPCRCGTGRVCWGLKLCWC